MARTLVILSALCLLLIAPTAASASPRLCQAGDSGGYGAAPQPKGVEATYLYAKLDGHWVEPPNVCVDITLSDSDPFNRYVALHLWNTNGFFFNLSEGAGIPTGTPITLGLSFPANATPLMAFGGYRDGLVGFAPDAVTIQAKTAPFTYIDSAYNKDKTALSGTLNCNDPRVTWDSTFGAFIRLPNLLPDGTEGGAYDSLKGSFFETNSLDMPIPRVIRNGPGNADLLIDVLGCGDHDPKTLEGYFDGFMAPGLSNILGLGSAAFADGSPFASSLMSVTDELAGAYVKASMKFAHEHDFQFDPIDGVTFTPLPSGPRPLGLLVGADFSYSKHRLDFHARTANLRVLKRCTRTHGKVVKRKSRLTCRSKRR